MIHLVQISLDELKEYIEIAYEGDRELLTKYHIGKVTFRQAVDKTFEMIEYTSKQADITHYGVFDGIEKIGYVSIFTHNLYSFSIAIEKRNKRVLKKFWQEIKKKMEASFITMLFPNNTRAIKFLQKCGMVIVDGVEENCVTLLKI